MIDDTRRPDSETDFDEPVFSSEEEEPAEDQTESSADGTPDPAPESSVDSETALPDIDEPVFASGGEPDESYALKPEEPFESGSDGQDVDPHGTSAAGTDWVNIAPDSESTAELPLETEYNFFDETPAAEVAAAPPSTRKLGRTGPVWVLGGTALVLIAGVVWLGISRLTGSVESSAQAPSEPAVQQVVAEEPTPAPPTSTPGPAPTPTPILLPVNANVIVGDTEGQGVKLRAQPGLAGELVEIIAEGTAMVVLDADPDAQHAEYPVPSDGYLWYRMRVTAMVDDDNNPLIGWSASEFFVIDAP